MGTEITYLSYLFVPVILGVNILLLFKGGWWNEKAAVLLFLNLSFLSYFLVSAGIDGQVFIGFLLGGFFLLPFQLVSVTLSLYLGGIIRRKRGSYGQHT